MAGATDDCAAAVAAHDRAYWSRSLPPTVVARAGAETNLWVHVPHGDPAHVWVRLEDGTVRPVCFYVVDMSEFSADKLANRGSAQAQAILTNVQDFIVNLWNHLKSE